MDKKRKRSREYAFEGNLVSCPNGGADLQRSPESGGTPAYRGRVSKRIFSPSRAGKKERQHKTEEEGMERPENSS